MDSDNIVLPEAIFEGVYYLEANDSVSVVTHYLDHFIDGVIWNIHGNSVCQHFTPLGQSLIIGQLINIIGDYFGTYRVADLKKMGGWDQRDNAKGEDLALYLKMTANRMKIASYQSADCFIADATTR